MAKALCAEVPRRSLTARSPHSAASQAQGLKVLLSLAEPDPRDRREAGGRSATVVILPARDEGSAIGDSLRSLARQTLRPDRIVVVVNNSTDDTAAVAASYAASPGAVPTVVLQMPGFNRYRKAGALNYGIRRLLVAGRFPSEISWVLVMDGDTDLDAHFLKRARRILERDDNLGGVSAACLGKPLHGDNLWQRLLLALQKIEYARFAATRLRRNVHTMSGAGSFYRAAALNGLLATRPDVFDQRDSNLVEDYETTLALKQLGWRITSNQGCIAYTDLMPSMRMLQAQRVRWVRGTVDEWRHYGWCEATWLSISGIFLTLAGIAYAAVWTFASARAVLVHHGHIDCSYLLLAAFWSVYQGMASRRLGWKAVLFEMTLLPEAAFNLVRNYWLARSVFASFRGSGRAWS